MKHNVIITKDYILIVNDEDIKEGHWCYYITFDEVFLITGKAVSVPENLFKEINKLKKHKKIIAHLPLNNAPYLDGVDVLPPLCRDNGEKDDVEQLANRFSNDFALTFTPLVVRAIREGFIGGYNKAKEKYKFTEEDIRAAIAYGRCLEITKGFSDITISESTLDSYIQSLQQPKLPIGFECEVEVYNKIKGKGTFAQEKRKTIINSDGRVEWLGKWLY